MREQDRKAQETRKLLGPRLPRSPRISGRVYGDLPVLLRSPRTPRLPRDTGG